MSIAIGEGTAQLIIKLHLPRGWKISHTENFVAGSHGECNFSRRTIFCPNIVDTYTACVFLHEVAHARLHGRRSYKSPSHVAEYEAEQFAIRAIRAFGLRAGKDIVQNAKDNVYTHAVRNRSEGVLIDKKVFRWCDPQAGLRKRCARRKLAARGY